jgi:cysteine sulfinate desulfinase/cysteine desulfurase-like protein
MGYEDEKASRALRFSSSPETTEADWNALSEALVKVHHALSRTERS